MTFCLSKYKTRTDTQETKKQWLHSLTDGNVFVTYDKSTAKHFASLEEAEEYQQLAYIGCGKWNIEILNESLSCTGR